MILIRFKYCSDTKSVAILIRVIIVSPALVTLISDNIDKHVWHVMCLVPVIC